MPWLLGTALLHSAIVVEKRNALKVWTILLAILTFSLSLIGTFIVRSGVLTSVHAFATDPERGFFILVLLAVAIGGSLVLFAIRAPELKAGGLFAPISREGGMVINNLFLSAACATVFLGTLYPLFVEMLSGGESKVSVGPPFFNATFVPLMVPLVFLMAVGPMLPWKRGDLAGALARLKLAALGAVIAAGVAYYLQSGGPVLAVAAIGLAAWLFVGALVEWGERVKLFRAPLAESWRRARNLPRAAHGMTLAHAGLAVVMAGMIGSSVWKSEVVTNLRPGETVEIAGYSLLFEGVGRLQGPNYRAERARFTVSRDGEEIAALFPEKRVYQVRSMPTTEAAIRTTWFSDLYAVIGDSDGQGGWTVRIYHEPLVPWIWLGCLVMVAGGLTSLSDRRLRVGAPGRQRKAGTASRPAAV
jgi:cytochrome c-type biogenesis protein CcmF